MNEKPIIHIPEDQPLNYSSRTNKEKVTDAINTSRDQAATIRLGTGDFGFKHDVPATIRSSGGIDVDLRHEHTLIETPDTEALEKLAEDTGRRVRVIRTGEFGFTDVETFGKSNIWDEF